MLKAAPLAPAHVVGVPATVPKVAHPPRMPLALEELVVMPELPAGVPTMITEVVPPGFRVKAPKVRVCKAAAVSETTAAPELIVVPAKAWVNVPVRTRFNMPPASTSPPMPVIEPVDWTVPLLEPKLIMAPG